MQEQDKLPKSSRPSLLTPAQQAEAERNRILSTLESSGTADKGKQKRPAWRRAALGAAVLALGVGAFYVMNQDGSPPQVAGAPPAHVPSAPAAPAATVTTIASVPAAITPAVATIEDQAAPATEAGKPRQSLSDMLGDTPAAPAPTKNVLSQALEAPAAKTETLPEKTAPKPASKPPAKKTTTRTDAKADKGDNKAEKHPFAKDVVGKGGAAPAPDGDVALLSALIAHAHASDAPAAVVKPRLSLDQQLAACAEMKGHKAARCHRRVCEGRSKTGGCKVSK